MDDIDLILEGMERELKHLDTEISALGERLAAGENAIRAELNPALGRADQLRSNIFELKRAYRRLSPIEQLWHAGGDCCCAVRPCEATAREGVLALQKTLAELEMQTMPHLCVLTDDAIALLAFAWDDPKGAIQSLADIRRPIHSDGRGVADAGHPWSAARWRAAVLLLEYLDLVEPLRFEYFELTWIGYRVAGLIHFGARPPKP